MNFENIFGRYTFIEDVDGHCGFFCDFPVVVYEFIGQTAAMTSIDLCWKFITGQVRSALGGGFKYYLFSSLFGEDFQFD